MVMITMISKQVLAIIRARTAQFLTETCLIESEELNTGAFGESLHTRIVVDAEVPCRVIMQSRTSGGTAAQVGNQETVVDTYRLIVPWGTALAVDQVVTVDGVEYQVVALVTERTNETDAQAVITRARTN